MEYEGLHWIDTAIVVASVLLAIGVGIYFAKKQNVFFLFRNKEE